MATKINQSTEVFRFACARPAKKESRLIRVRKFNGEETRRIASSSREDSDSIRRLSVSSAASSSTLKYNSKITALNDHLDIDELEIDIGRVTELSADIVRGAIQAVFGNENLANLVRKDDWKADERKLDQYLYERWEEASDPFGRGPQVARWRQLYDLVRQAVDLTTGQKDEEPFVLKGFEISSLFNDGEIIGSRTNNRQLPRTTLRDARVNAGDDAEDELNKAKEQNLAAALRILNTSAILPFRALKLNQHSQFMLRSDWMSILTDEARKAVTDLGVSNPNPPEEQTVTFYYSTILNALKSTPVSRAVAKTRTGLFEIGPFNLEVKKPWIFGFEGFEEGDDGLPAMERSKIKPAGVADLLVVRDHVYEYIGGDIGAIQNVLASETLIRETKRLDRVETVTFSSFEQETEREEELQTTTRFALNREANEIIKQDSALKAGVSTTAYGPTVTVKGDFSASQNNSTESSNRVATQFSQDITSRASSKVIEKTFNSISRTTISEFQETNRHEFTNGEPGSQNISGVYQWVNKVSQCQMYNYGKRLLIDIVVPEPAAFLMSQTGADDALLQEPSPLIETAAEINESNYAQIAARYQTAGIKPPGDLLYSYSKSFKADIQPNDNPKLTGGNPFSYGSSGSVNMDVEIPAGYLAYAAKIQVGVRTGPGVDHWEEFRGTNYPEHGTIPTPNPYVCVAGRVVRGQVTKGEVEPIPKDPPETGSDQTDESLKQNTVGTVFFTEPLMSKHIAIAIAQDFCLALSGSIQISCIREPLAYLQWQQQTYDSIVTAYLQAKANWERARSETAIATMNVTTGNNPLDNARMISTELKKSSIAFLTSQNFEKFGTVDTSNGEKIPQVTEFQRAINQGWYASFFEKAFEWENITYELFPYFWGDRNTWRDRLAFQSPDPNFTAFIKAGMAKVTVPARLGYGLEVIHMLDSGKLWHDGPVSSLATKDYSSLVQEVLDAEANPTEVKISEPWYTVIPTDLVQLRANSVLPRFKLSDKGFWVEKKPNEE